MEKTKILANLSNLLVTIFLVILIPVTIIGTYSIVVQSDDIKENTKFRIETEQSLDSLRIQLRIEKYINDVHRTEIKQNLKQYENN